MPEQTIVPIEQLLPNKLFMIPLMGRPIFPGIFTPVMINNPDDVKVVDEVYSGDGFIGISMLNAETEQQTVSDLCPVGTVARIIKKINLPDGGVNVFISTLKRFRVRKIVSERAPMVAIVDYLDDEEDDTFEVKALTRALIGEMKEISENNPLFSEEMRLNMINIDHPGKIADFIASILNIEKQDQQRILEIQNVRQRMEQVLVFIKKEQELLKVQKKIQTEINSRIEKNQRDYFLREELKAIKEELGMTTDAKSSDYQKFKEKLDAYKFEGEIKEAVESELEKFALMDSNSGEYIVTRNYLETIVNLPWGVPQLESWELAEARAVLDGDHYGLEDVKKRIIEYLAVRKLKKDTKGSIILLVGPPGVGKTSVGRSIARAMGKPFFRFSVGGMRDEAEIKGTPPHVHRRDARQDHTGTQDRQVEVAGVHDRRGRQDGAELSGRSVERAPRGPRSRAEHRVSRSLPRPAVRSFEYSFHIDGEYARLDSRSAYGPRRSDPAFGLHRHREARDREKILDPAEPR